MVNGVPIRPEDSTHRQNICDQIRILCQQDTIANAQLGWNTENKFALETAAQGAKVWVHIDVRKFNVQYLDDKFFCKNTTTLKGKSVVEMLRGKS